jgi:hypothetical protein
MLASGAILAPGPPPTTAKDRAVGKGSFVPSINVDGCIIEEQDDQLVPAIRVPKATIVSNLALLAAMAECCGMAVPRVWSTRDDPPCSEGEDQQEKPDLEGLLLRLVSATPIMQRELAHAVNNPGGFGALDSLAFIVSTVVETASELDDLDPIAGAALYKAAQLLQKRMGQVLNEAEPEWDALQLSISAVTKLAHERDVANEAAYATRRAA